MDDAELTHFISFRFKFNCIRVLDNFFLPSTFKGRVEVAASPDNESGSMFPLDKIRFWLKHIENSIVIYTANQEAADMLVDPTNMRYRAGNELMLSPIDPTDTNIAILLQSKFNALADGELYFGPIQIESDLSEDLVFTFIGDAHDELPTWEDWIPQENPNWFDKPWWMRNDSSTMDISAPVGTDVSETPDWAFSLDFLRDEPSKSDGHPTIIAAKFKPTVIEGGKK